MTALKFAFICLVYVFTICGLVCFIFMVMPWVAKVGEYQSHLATCYFTPDANECHPRMICMCEDGRVFGEVEKR